jgi:hypothetical protein
MPNTLINPVVLSTLVIAPGTVTIPATVNGLRVQRYAIFIRGIAGTGNTIKYNVAGATPILDVEVGDKYVIRCNGRSIVALIVALGVGGKIKIDVLKD